MSGWHFLMGTAVAAVGALAFLKLVADDVELAEESLRQYAEEERKANQKRREEAARKEEERQLENVEVEVV